MEVWNNVFSQFNNDGHDNYTELKQKNIDTGMGLERLAVVCQQVDSLFDVDTVMNITNKVSEITGAHYEREPKDRCFPAYHHRPHPLRYHDDRRWRPARQRAAAAMCCAACSAVPHGMARLLGVARPFLYEVCDTVIHENRGRLSRPGGEAGLTSPVSSRWRRRASAAPSTAV